MSAWAEWVKLRKIIGLALLLNRKCGSHSCTFYALLSHISSLYCSRVHVQIIHILFWNTFRVQVSFSNHPESYTLSPETTHNTCFIILSVSVMFRSWQQKPLEGLSEQTRQPIWEVWGRVPKVCISLPFLVMLMLLQGPHFENHCSLSACNTLHDACSSELLGSRAHVSHPL